ncbi:MAG: C25 family cysteine peptidase, partial [Acidobacteriota bacterium]|nr:C25 family cysteine peptidase [Acidobacteriota bacterium]
AASFQLQTTGTGNPTWTDVGPESQRLLSGSDDKGAGVIYAIADSLAAGTHRFRLLAKTSDGTLSVFGSTLVGVSLVFPAPAGLGGYFPHFQDTIASDAGTNANLEPMLGLEAGFNLNTASDVFLAMSYSAQTTSSGAGDKGSWEAAILNSDPVPAFVFGDENGPPSQEVDRFFGGAVDVGNPPVSTNDIGAGGLVAVAQNLASGSYTAIGQHAITGNPMNTIEPNLVGFVPVSVATTPAVVSGLRAFSRHGRVVVGWQTVSEDGTLGFHLYRLNRTRGEFERVNRGLLAARLSSPQGGWYQLVDDDAIPGDDLTYMVVEVGATGPNRVHGPYVTRTDDSHAESRFVSHNGAEDPPAIRGRPGIEMQRRTDPEARRPPGRQGVTRLDLSVSEPGLYQLSASEISQRFSLSNRHVQAAIRHRRLKLTRHGRDVAWKGLAGGEGLLFFAAGLESRYTDVDVFQLRFGKGTTMEHEAAVSEGGAPAESFETTLLVEENRIPATAWVTDPQSDIWFWDLLLASDNEAVNWSTRFELPGVATSAGEARLDLAIMPLTGGAAGSSHHLAVSLNGHDIGNVGWDGTSRQILSLTADQVLLREKANELVVRSESTSATGSSVVLLDSLEVTYQRRFRAVGDELAFTTRGEKTISVTGFGSPHVFVVDVTEPDAARWVDGVRIEAESGDFGVSFEAPRPGRYLTLTAAALREPLAIEPGYDSNLRQASRRADHLIIAPREFVDVAETLAEHRRAGGLLSRVVELEEIYNEFNHGLADPEAIRAFLRIACLEWTACPRYVVLAGRGTFDPRDFRGLSDDLVPVKFVRGVQGMTAADAVLGDVAGDDGIPEIAVGRLPVVTRGELAATIDKLIRYDEAGGGGWADWGLFAADNGDTAGQFAPFADRLAARWPGGVQKIFLDDRPVSEARAELLAALDQGAGLFTFVGHGGGDRLAAEGLLRAADLVDVANAERLPVFAAATCLVNRFDIPGFPSLGERLVLHPAGGAVAAWSPAGQSFNAQSTRLVELFVKNLFSDGVPQRLGDAALAVARSERATGAGPFMAPLFALLGDPATRVK